MDAFSKLVLKQDFESVMIPSIHLEYFEQIGYQHLVSGFGPLDFVLLGSKKRGISKVSDLKGKDVLLNGDYTTLSVIWRGIEKKHDLVGKTNIAYHAHVDQLLMRLLRGQGDATITFRRFYNRIPEQLKASLIELDSRTMKHPGTVVINEEVNERLAKQMKAAYIKRESWFDRRPSQDIRKDAYVHERMRKTFGLY